jgi:hypothetical protein
MKAGTQGIDVVGGEAKAAHILAFRGLLGGTNRLFSIPLPAAWIKGISFVGSPFPPLP